MNYIKYNNVTGEIVGTLNTNMELEEWTVGEFSFISVPEAIDQDSMYYKNGVFLQYPEKPGKHYDWNGDVWVLNNNKLIVFVKNFRDTLLQESDWTDTVSAVSRLGQNKYKAWQDYRQALRDITTQEGYPASITWPTKPQ